jgi:mannose-6-phosphate isomerase
MAVEWYPLRFEPIFKHALWGGRSLRPLFGLEARDELEGEAWLVSDQGDNLSQVTDGPLQGVTLRDLMLAHRKALIGDAAAPHGRFPLLLKLLDARQPLSVQVHPNDEQALHLEPASAGFGKTEAWVILKTEPGSLLYAGFREGAQSHQFRDALTGGTLPDVLHAFSPVPGDCVFLEAGTVHAIGGGLMLFEVQQTSDITYRLFDWGRVDAKTGQPRQLHIEPALLCANVERGPCRPVTPEPLPGTERERLVSCRYFTLERFRTDKRFSVGAPGCCRLAVCVEGRAVVEHRGKSYPLKLGDVLLMPAVVGACPCIPDGTATILECGIP